MLLAVTILLALALAFTLLKLWSHLRATRHLQRAIQLKQPLLREDLPGASGANWDDLCHATNELIIEAGNLQRSRTSQLAQLEATLGSLQEAVLIVDAGNHILLANKALQAIFPRAVNPLSRRLEQVLQSAAFLNYVDAVRHANAQPQQEIEFADDARSVWTEVTGSIIPPLNGQKEPWALFVLHDITKQKKLEFVRKEFVANVSHELRTPLSVIKGYTETLVDGHDSLPASDRDRFLRTIQRHTERLTSLLEDLLTLSRLESINPGLRRESTDLKPLILGVLEDFRNRPASKGQALTARLEAAPRDVLVDPLKITQVLENLIDNAIKYTPKEASITVSSELRDREIELCVADNGPGIPAEDLPHLFERFYRVDKGRSREKGGTGLGLSIVKHIVQLHGGRVWATSTLGQGTAFYFTIPTRRSVA